MSSTIPNGATPEERSGYARERLDERIETSVIGELLSAQDRFGPFNSSHEGYAVVLEEVEELLDEVAMVQSVTGGFWQEVKANDDEGMAGHAKAIEIAAMRAAAEAVQVAAMARRFRLDVKAGAS